MELAESLLFSLVPLGLEGAGLVVETDPSGLGPGGFASMADEELDGAVVSGEGASDTAGDRRSMLSRSSPVPRLADRLAEK